MQPLLPQPDTLRAAMARRAFIGNAGVSLGAAALAAGTVRLLQEMAGSNDNTEDN